MAKIRSILSSTEQLKAQTFFSTKKQYESELLKAQMKLLSLQQKIFRQKKKVVIVLEGTDTAGKGGLIRRMAQYLDPRPLQVYGIGKPQGDEIGQHYLQRFFSRLPALGEIAVFDRSWYGRVLVERVESFAKPNEWKRAFDEINSFEKMLIDDEILVLKYLLDISHVEQGKRFKDRENDPLKSWKMTDEDYRNRKKWDAYQVAFREMIKKTSPQYSPWKIVPANSKWFARVEVLNDIVKRANKFF